MIDASGADMLTGCEKRSHSLALTGRSVSIDEQWMVARPAMFVSGEVDFADYIRRDRRKPFGRVNPQIEAADEQIVDVEQQSTTRSLGEARKKRRLAHD